MCECLDYDDGTRHTCEACVNDLELMRRAMNAADARAEKAEAALAEERERREGAEAGLERIEEVTRGSGIGPAAAAWNLAAYYLAKRDAALRAALKAAPAQPEMLPTNGCINGWCDRKETHYHRQSDNYGYGVVEIDNEVTRAFDRLKRPAPLEEAAARALDVLTEIADSAAYWSEYDVPLGIVSRVDEAKARLAAALAARPAPAQPLEEAVKEAIGKVRRALTGIISRNEEPLGFRLAVEDLLAALAARGKGSR